MILQNHQKEMNEIEDIMFAMEKNFEESEAEARQEFHSLRDEIKNKVCIMRLSFVYLLVRDIYLGRENGRGHLIEKNIQSFLSYSYIFLQN